MPHPFRTTAWRHLDRVRFERGSRTARRQMFVRPCPRPSALVGQPVGHGRIRLASARHCFADRLGRVGPRPDARGRDTGTPPIAVRGRRTGIRHSPAAVLVGLTILSPLPLPALLGSSGRAELDLAAVAAAVVRGVVAGFASIGFTVLAAAGGSAFQRRALRCVCRGRLVRRTRRCAARRRCAVAALGRGSLFPSPSLIRFACRA